jgi:hypothetical protein
MRHESSTNLHERQDLYKAGKLGMLIDLLSCPSPKGLDLQTHALLPDNHKPLRDSASGSTRGHRWYAIPRNLDPAADVLAKNPEWYKTLYHYDSEVHQGLPLHVESNIP